MPFQGNEGPPTKWFPDFEKGLPDMSGKTVAITGTTSGTGLVAAKTCAAKGATVYILNRPSSRADAALQEVQQAAAGAGSVTYVPCDLQSFASVREAAAKVASEVGEHGLNVLCHNAAIMSFPDKATADGCQQEIQTNHLSPFLLTAQLMPQLEAAAATGGARVVFHSSGARKMGGAFDRKYFEPGTEWGGDDTNARHERYHQRHQSKLANVLTMAALQDRLAQKGSKIEVMSCVPGFAVTSLAQNTFESGSKVIKLFFQLLSWTSQSAEDGTMPLLHCICSTEPPEKGTIVVPKNGCVLGMLIRDGVTGPPMTKPLEAKCQLEADKAALWEASQKTCGVTML